MEDTEELRLEFGRDAEPLERHAARSLRGVSVEYSRLKLPAEYDFSWQGHSHYLAYHDLVLLDGEMEVLGEAPVAGGDLREQMTYVPSGVTLEGWAKPAHRLNAFTVVYFNTDVMEEELQAEFRVAEARPRIYFKDDELGSTMRKLGQLLGEQGEHVSKVYAETLGLAAALEMFRTMTAVPQLPDVHGRGQLTNGQKRLLNDYLQEHLSGDIGLDELAVVCGLSRYHFSRAFKATYGEPPYQYLTRLRTEKACHLLAESHLSIAEIAIACGFNGVSQFGRAFKNIVGQSPLAFRRRA
ncbi:AraC family transcriptional regulator [Ciceribacter sp. L1K22]|uniref:helix-turn-helix domain-containing protein n=1 Tax=Ciceribacter sp. L1K22 TaxID=2820275 RepID=UPI001ABE212A|nr:AraC family transcriptional regulator [Ciceribacter sp. L1K22]MBO3758468.1 helix-turn-helix transcriptional regulator [Ciceribacter sp. L1K22]